MNAKTQVKDDFGPRLAQPIKEGLSLPVVSSRHKLQDESPEDVEQKQENRHRTVAITRCFEPFAIRWWDV